MIRKNMAHTRQNYNKKIPDEKRIIRQHFRAMGERRRKAKMTFETEDDAWEFVNAHCLHGLVVYQCRFCGKWHFGHPNEDSYEQTER